MSDRLNQFKNRGKDLETNRNRRKEDVVVLRKARKDEQLSKRRNIHMAEQEFDDEFESDNNNPSSPQPRPKTLADGNVDIELLVKGLHSNNYDEVYQATNFSRRILSKQKNPPIDKFIELNAVEKFVQFLKASDHPDLQFEAAWALTNIASGTALQTRAVVDQGACPYFVELLNSPHSNVVEQSIWALANIAGDGTTYRDKIINLGAIPLIVRFVQPDTPTQFLANVSWCLSNLCRNKDPAPEKNAIKACLPAIKELMLNESNDVAADACWSLSYISDGTDDRIQLVIDLGVLDRLVQIVFESKDRSLVVPALRTLGNIVTGTDTQTQAVIDHNALPAFRKLLEEDALSLRKEVAWALSNITAGNQSQIQAVVDARLIPHMVNLLRCGDTKTQKEAIWAVSNMTCGGSLDQILLLINAGVVEPLVELLDTQDSKITLIILDAIKNVLLAAEKMDKRDALCDALEQFGFVDHLEKLQVHENVDVYKSAVKLIEEYWGGEDEDPEQQVAASGDGQQYVFNPPPNSNNQNGSQQFNF